MTALVCNLGFRLISICVRHQINILKRKTYLSFIFFYLCLDTGSSLLILTDFYKIKF